MESNPKTPGTDRKSVLRRIQEKKRELRYAEDREKKESNRTSKAFRDEFKSKAKDQRRTSLEMRVDREIIQKQIQIDQSGLVLTQGSIEIPPHGSEVTNTLLTKLVQNLDYNKDINKNQFGKKRTLPLDIKTQNDIYDNNANTVSEVFLRRALSKSAGGSMLVLNDSYHLRSYLDSSTGQIQLTTPQMKDRNTNEAPLLPAEQHQTDQYRAVEGRGGNFFSPPHGMSGGATTTSPGREGQESDEHQVASPKGDICALVSNRDAQPTHALSDCVFLVGPDKEEVEVMVSKYLSSRNAEGGSQRETPAFAGSAAGGEGVRERSFSSGRARSASSSSSASFSSGASSMPTQPQTKSLEPRLLYHTQLHQDLEAELVPYFCFPGGANVTVRPPLTVPSGTGGASSWGNTDDTPKMSVGLQSPNASFRRKSATGMGLNHVYQAGSVATRPASNVRCFSFLLSSHFSTQYGICFVFQRTYHYHDKTGRFGGVSLNLNVDYCVCVVTKVPFLSFLFHTLTQFEALGGLDHHGSGFGASTTSSVSPGSIVPAMGLSQAGTASSVANPFTPPLYVLPMLEDMFRAQEEGMPLQADLRLLDGLANRLAGTTLPLYPHLVEDLDHFFSLSETLGAREGEEHSPAGDRAGTRTRTRTRTQSSSSINSGREGGFDEWKSNCGTTFAPLVFSVLVKQQHRLEMALDRDAVWRSFARHMKPLFASPVDGALTLGQGYGGVASSPVRVERDKKINSRGRMAQATQYLNSVASDRDLEGGQHVLCWALPILLRHVPLDQLLMALGCALNEMKILVLSEDTTVLSGCVLAIWRLLRPLKWAGNIIVTLPNFLCELLESPSFFLIGMQALPPDFSLSQGLIIIDTQECAVKLHPADVVVSHTLQVPLHTRLLMALKPHAEGVMQAYRSCRRDARQREREQRLMENGMGLGLSSPGKGIGADPRPHLISPKSVFPDSRSPLPSAQHHRHSRPSIHATPPALPVYATSIPKQFTTSVPPLPSELDPSSSTGKSLCASVASFYSVMSQHLQTILNTAVRQEEERSKRDRKQKLGRAEEAEEVTNTQNRGKNGIRAGINRAFQSIRPKEEEKGKDMERKRKGQGSAGKMKDEEEEADSQKFLIPELSRSTSNKPTTTGTITSGMDHETSVDNAASRSTEGGRSPSTKSLSYSPGVGYGSVDSDQYVDKMKEKHSSSPLSVTSPSLSEILDIEKERIKEGENALTFSSKEIGESGVVFLKQLLRTQAFSNYLFDSTQRGFTRKMSEVRQQYKAQLTAHKECLGREATKLETGKGADLGEECRGSLLDQMTTHDPLGLGEGMRESTLTSLFTIAITGSMPVEKARVNELQASLKRLNERLENDAQQARELAKKGAQSHQVTHSPVVVEPAVKDWLRGDPMLSPPSTQDIEAMKMGEGSGILWCNGRCGGMADTPHCTVMCVVLWSKRLQRAKSSFEVQSLIRKYHAGSGTSAYPQNLGHYHPREKMLAGLALQCGQSVSVRVNSVPKRHPRETDTQFQLRLGEAGLVFTSPQAATAVKSLVDADQRQARKQAIAEVVSGYSINADLISRVYGRRDLPVNPTARARVLVLRLMRRQKLLSTYTKQCRKVGIPVRHAHTVFKGPGLDVNCRLDKDKNKDKKAAGVVGNWRKRTPIHAIEALVTYHSDQHLLIQRRRRALAINILMPFMLRVVEVVRYNLLLRKLSRLQIRRWLRTLDGYLNGSGFHEIRYHLKAKAKAKGERQHARKQTTGVSFFPDSPPNATIGTQSLSYVDFDCDQEDSRCNGEDEEQAQEREKERHRSRVQTIRDQMGTYFTPTHSSSGTTIAGLKNHSHYSSERMLGAQSSPYHSDSGGDILNRQSSSFPSISNSGRPSCDPDSNLSSVHVGAETNDISVAVLVGARGKEAAKEEVDEALDAGKGKDKDKHKDEDKDEDKGEPSTSSARLEIGHRHSDKRTENQQGIKEPSHCIALPVVPLGDTLDMETNMSNASKDKAASLGTKRGPTLRIQIDMDTRASSPENRPGPKMSSPVRSSDSGMLAVSLETPKGQKRGGTSPGPPISVTVSPKTKRGASKGRRKDNSNERGSSKDVYNIATATTGRGSDLRDADNSSKSEGTVSSEVNVDESLHHIIPSLPRSPSSHRGTYWSDDVPVSPDSDAVIPKALLNLSPTIGVSDAGSGDDQSIFEDTGIANVPRGCSTSMSGRSRGRIDSIDSISGASMRVLTHSRLDDTSLRLLRALGPAASDELTSQQLSMVVDMYSLLREGISISKHSSGAAPQRRVLFCDINLSVLYWRVPGSFRLPDSEEEEVVRVAHAKSKASSLRESTGRASLLSGDNERSIFSSSVASASSSSWSLFGSSNKDRILLLRDVSEVSAEIGNSPILKRAVDRGYIQRAGKRRENGQPQYLDLAGNKIGLVSVAGRTRNLVFDMEQKMWGELFHALQVLVNYFRSQSEYEEGLEVDLSELI